MCIRDSPKVTPKSGDYNKKTEIKITVPDGCKAYYAFDSEPDLNSTCLLYTSSTFYVEKEHILEYNKNQLKTVNILKCTRPLLFLNLHRL